MKYLHYLIIGIALCTTGAVQAAEQPLKIGVVNFKKCVESSKLGKHEQTTFEGFKKEMEGAIVEKEKELNDLAGKLNDPDYLDGLSPEAENELKHKFRILNQEVNQFQSQYYQALQQANFKIIQKIGSVITEAAQAVAKEQGLDIVLNEESSFFYSEALDISKKVVALMDETFEKESAKESLLNVN